MSDIHKFPIVFPNVAVGGNDLPGITFNIPPNGVGIYLYNPVAIAIGETVTVVFGSTDRQEVASVADGVASNSVFILSAVALEAVAAEKVGRFQIFGKCQALCEGTTDIAVDDYLEIVTGHNYMTKDGSYSNDSMAVAKQAYTVAISALKTVWLMGCPHFINS